MWEGETAGHYLRYQELPAEEAQWKPLEVIAEMTEPEPTVAGWRGQPGKGIVGDWSRKQRGVTASSSLLPCESLGGF